MMPLEALPQLALVCLFSAIGVVAICYDPHPTLICAICMLTLLAWAVMG